MNVPMLRLPRRNGWTRPPAPQPAIGSEPAGTVPETGVAVPGTGREDHGGRERPRLGRLLLAHSWLCPDDLRSALLLQRRTPYRLGTVLTAHGWSSETSVAAALAEQRGLGFVDLVASPPDPALLEGLDIAACLRCGLLPWRRVGRVTTYAAVDPLTVARALRRIGVRPDLVCVVVTTRSALEAAVAHRLRAALTERAANRVPAGLSVRSLGRLRGAAAVLIAVFAALVWVGNMPVLACALMLLFALNGATMALRIAALTAGRRRPDGASPAPAGTVDLIARRSLPRISLLVPLYREAGMIGDLVLALEALDYPRERLEVRLLLEEDDTRTIAAVAAARLPVWMIPMVVPRGRPRTKPRALNYALDFCTGDIVGILDAEDRPDPRQLRDVAGSLAAAPPEVACVQCQLSYHNADQNWLSRCFQIEYSIWFDVLLRGFEALRLPIPLGGTSVYFRRGALVASGGWDAHNVTEDADLGMRLARRGMRCGVLRSVTQEEANCVTAGWIRQRSRWLKGYLLTWLNHMRDPVRLWRDLGPAGFFALNVLFLGAAATYLAMPLFWAAMIGWLLGAEGLWQSALPAWAVWPAALMLVLGQAVMLGCAAIAMVRRGTPGLLWWVPTLPFYWTLGAIAAWKAVIELGIAPFWWDKTHHGISRSAGSAE